MQLSASKQHSIYVFGDDERQGQCGSSGAVIHLTRGAWVLGLSERHPAATDERRATRRSGIHLGCRCLPSYAEVESRRSGCHLAWNPNKKPQIRPNELLQNLPGDDHPVDLVGSLIDLGDLQTSRSGPDSLGLRHPSGAPLAHEPFRSLPSPAASCRPVPDLIARIEERRTYLGMTETITQLTVPDHHRPCTELPVGLPRPVLLDPGRCRGRPADQRPAPQDHPRRGPDLPCAPDARDRATLGAGEHRPLTRQRPRAQQFSNRRGRRSGRGQNRARRDRRRPAT